MPPSHSVALQNRTRRWFLDAVDQARRQWNFDLWAYVVMPEHVHLLIFPKADAYRISDILKSIKQPVASQAMDYLRLHAPPWLEQLKVTWPNGRTEYHFWQQGGGYDRNIYEPATAWAAVDYLHLNPVRRGLVATPVEWPWSSARCYAGVDGVELPVDGKPPDPV